MADWLLPAARYCQEWITFQMRSQNLPGVGFAMTCRGQIIAEAALGVANAETSEPLTLAHRFRVASHSKTFTAVAILKLADQGKIRLDDAAGSYVDGLREDLAKVTLRQLLSHTSGLMRDGDDSGHWQDRQPFLNEAELRAQLAAPGTIDANTLFKYSNLGFGLAGLVIERVTGESYPVWMQREIVDAAGLRHTFADAPIPDAMPFSCGHSGTLPMGRRVIAGRNVTFALASATGFVSTAADLACFFAMLDPDSPATLLSRASRLEMVRATVQFTSSGRDRSYGLGVMSGVVAGLRWFGHTGAFQGFRSRTVVLPDCDITVSVTTNALDAAADPWVDSLIGIIAQFRAHGAASVGLSEWSGRWWNVWGAVDLVPMGDKVIVASPTQAQPFSDPMELTIRADNISGRISSASGMASFGEAVSRSVDSNGKTTAIRLGGSEFLPEAEFIREVMASTSG